MPKKSNPRSASNRGKLRATGIDAIKKLPWGSHFCLFYRTKKDLVDILVPYFKNGLINNEFCIWVTSAPLSADEAKKALKDALPDFDVRLARGQIEIIPYEEWYLAGGSFDSSRVLKGWVSKLNTALKKGFSGLRLTGNTFWLEKNNWQAFTEYEKLINKTIGKYQMLALCTYSLDRCDMSEIMDVISNHQFAVIKYSGRWSIIGSSEQKKGAKGLREVLGIYERNLSRTMRELKTISKCNEILVRATNETDLLKKICQTIVDVGGYRMAWVGCGENNASKSVTPIEQAGFEKSYLDSAHIVWSDTERGRGPTGTAIRTGKVCIEKDIQTDPKFTPWREEALKRGYGSSISLPIQVNSNVCALTIYASEPDAFDDEEVRLLCELADDLSFGIKSIRSLVGRRQAEEALRLASVYNRSIIEVSLDPLVTISPEGKITDVNQATIKVTGVSRERLIGTNFSNYFTEPQKAQEAYEQVLQKGFITDYPLTIKSDGHSTDVLYNATVYRDEAGKVSGIFAAARDYTRLKQITEQLQSKNYELEKINKTMIGRELKMVELKKENEDLKRIIKDGNLAKKT